MKANLPIRGRLKRHARAASGSLLLVAAVATAQYAIDWSTLDGGGGRSSGGPYEITGTIGQSDAAVSSAGAYSLEGGFWSTFAVVPVEGAPPLRIERSGDNVLLIWPNPSTGFFLQVSASMAVPNWTNVTDVPSIVGGEKQVRQPLTPAMKFYRLNKP